MSINISFKLLNAFLILMECRNFTRAAEHAHVSQSAFSGMIQRLEEELGARLFSRNTRNVALTPEGELFAQSAKRLVDDIEWTFSDLRDYVTQKKGRVGVAALPSISGGWLPPVIAAYRDQYPNISLEIHDVLSDNCLELLDRGHIDIALAAPRESPEPYAYEHFYTDRFFLVCRYDHPIAKQKSIQLNDLEGYHFIHLAPSTSIYQHTVEAIKNIKMSGSSIEVENLSTMSGFIRNGVGISLLPELTLSQFNHPELIALPLEPAGISRSIYIIWRKDKPLSISAQSMLTLFREKKPIPNSGISFVSP